MNWKKKPGSKPQRPVLDGDGDLASKVRAVYPSEKQKMEPKPDEHIPWEPVSSEEHIQDVKVLWLSLFSHALHARAPMSIIWLITEILISSTFIYLAAYVSQRPSQG